MVGIQYPGLKLEDVSLYSIEDMARYYLERVYAMQPQGPYSFVGWSIGGLIAHEMAKQAREAMHEVSTLALIDTYDPTKLAEIKQSDENAFIQYLLSLLFMYFSAMQVAPLTRKDKFKIWIFVHAGARLKYFWPLLRLIGLKKGSLTRKKVKNVLVLLQQDLLSAGKSVFPLDEWISFARENDFIPDEITNESLRVRYRVFREIFYASEHYKPAVYDGNAIYFEAAESKAGGYRQKYFAQAHYVVLPVNHDKVVTNKVSLKMIADYFVEKEKS